MSTAGVSIKAGIIHLAAVTAPTIEGRVADAMPSGTSKLTFSSSLSGAAQLLDLKDRVRQDLREWNVTAVHLLDTTKYVNWKYTDAHTRVLAVSAVMYAAAEEAIDYRVVKPSIAGRLVLNPKLDAIDHEIFGFDTRPTHWSAGLGQAFSVAATGVSSK